MRIIQDGVRGRKSLLKTLFGPFLEGKMSLIGAKRVLMERLICYTPKKRKIGVWEWDEATGTRLAEKRLIFERKWG